ncbi:MAG: polymer-forming cytoskeletal protein [Vulcanimicrobiaceae bacterium]
MFISATVILLLACIAWLLYPMLRELGWPRDAAQFDIDQGFAREPRFFGIMLRRALEPYAVRHPGGNLVRTQLLDGHHKVISIAGDIRASNASRLGDVLVSVGSVFVEEACTMPIALVRGEVTTDSRAQLTALAADGSIRLGRRSRVALWIDAEGDVVASENCDLGNSTSAGGSIRLTTGCSFGRLFGRPIMTTTSSPMLSITPALIGRVASERDRLSVGHGTLVSHDIVSPAPIRLGADSVVRGSLKSYASIEVFSGARVEGSMFARGSVIVHPGARIFGNVYAEGEIWLASFVRVGAEHAFISVYSGRSIVICNSVCIYGWVLAEQGGIVR